MNLPKIIITAISCIVVSCSVYAAQGTHFNSLTVSDGLPHGTIWAIEQDKKGYIWFGTRAGLSRYNGYNFNNYVSSSSNPHSISGNIIKAIHKDKKERLWIGTDQNGLNYYSNDKFYQFNHNDALNSLSSDSITAINSNNLGVWIGTDKGLDFLPYGSNHFKRISTYKTSTIASLSDDSLLIGSDKGVILLSPDSKEKRNLNIPFPDKKLRIRNITQFSVHELLIATNENLYRYNINSKKLDEFSSFFADTPVLDIESTDDGIWIATFNKGLFKISNNKLINYKHSLERASSINSNIVLSLLKDNSNNLWAGHFDKGINNIQLQSHYFGMQNSGAKALSCLESSEIYSISDDSNGSLLINSSNEAALFNISTQKCQKFKNPHSNNLKNFNFFLIYRNFIDSQQNYWFATSEGLLKANKKNNMLEYTAFNSKKNRVTSIAQINGKQLIITTPKSVYKYQHKTSQSEPYKIASELKSSNIKKVYQHKDKVFFITSKGIATIENNKLTPFPISNNISTADLIGNEPSALYLSNDSLFAGFSDNMIYQFDYSGNLTDWYPLDKGQSFAPPLNILMDAQGENLWASTFNGLYRVNLKSKVSKRFSQKDGLQSDSFIKHSSFSSSDGKLYFGGANGFNAFYPEDIKNNPVAPKVVLTELRRFNKVVTPDSPAEDFEGFSINAPIESLTSLEMGHRDYVMSLEFAALHYADPARNQYAYKLDGLHDDWIETGATNRIASLTNLSPGKYLFRVKAANKDGVWSLPEDEVALRIIVHPAPWLSWWAYTIYISIFILSLLWFIRYRTQASIKRAAELEVEVTERTKEINTQKEVIESLLERKNELFANISHEFRTPLTLILGPLEKELSALDSPKNPKHLQMIKRNANRLLGMVEQILKLTELKKEETINKVPHAVKSTLDVIIESFGPLAESKQIQLSLAPVADCTLLVSNDALEVMVGNLVSNAIKYTPESGQVNVAASVQDSTVHIQVTDTGVGMSKAQQEEVFERFVRLDKTSDIAGTGIGLSIVKELIKAHQGTISVESVEGQGSTFTLSLPVTEQQAGVNQPLLQAISHLTHVEEKDEGQTATDTNTFDGQNISSSNTLLIIDDNRDMQDYICATLESDYRCLTAERGEVGIETAIIEIPDLIICDVMMPGIDGYEVARRLRQDEQTSHIPIVLLTAKGDKESRIQGWNEHIDDYMTKPFDELELKTRISNILSIRDILKRRSSIKFLNNELKPLPAITSQDQKFLDRLKQVLEDNFHDSLFLRPNMAEKMAISERQLQRKLKAIIDLNPIDYLRNFRLDKAAELLHKGIQVSLVSHECGFNSPSNFARCFKAKYGITPRNYQNSSSVH